MKWPQYGALGHLLSEALVQRPHNTSVIGRDLGVETREFLNGEVRRDLPLARPVEQPSRNAVVLSQCIHVHLLDRRN